MKQFICFGIVIICATSLVSAQKVVLRENFNDNHNAWGIFPDTKPSYAIYNGKYIMDVTDSSTYCSMISVNIDTTKNYSISAIAVHTSGTNTYGYGLSFGGTDPNNYYLFSISDGGYFSFGKFVAGTFSSLIKWTTNAAIKTGNYVENKLQVTKEGRSWKLLVNDQLLSTIDAMPLMGSKAGFSVSVYQRIEFDDLTILQ
jgi:hypothetical protein